MQNQTTNQPELACQWCGGTIPANAPTCAVCGATRPRDDLVAPGLTLPEGYLIPSHAAVSVVEDPDDDAVRARQILKDLDAYIPDEPAASRKKSSDPLEDAMVIIGILLIGGVVGGLTGWFLAPPLLHEFFHDVVGVDSEGPEAFRRLGAFLVALVAMLFGALLAMVLRR